MTSGPRSFVHVRAFVAIAVVGFVAAPSPRAGADAGDPQSVTALVRAALAARLGPDVDIEIAIAGLAAGAGPFTEARLDPAARLGRPFVARLVPASSRAVVPVTVTAKVVAPQVVAAHAIPRAQVVTAADVVVVRREIENAPLRPLPVLAEVVGGRALRLIPAGATLLPGFVHVRRTVEPGDEVTAIFATGEIEITATLVAADGGRVGDRIRIVNPGTKRSLWGRVVARGIVEVTHGR